MPKDLFEDPLFQDLFKGPTQDKSKDFADYMGDALGHSKPAEKPKAEEHQRSKIKGLLDWLGRSPDLKNYDPYNSKPKDSEEKA